MNTTRLNRTGTRILCAATACLVLGAPVPSHGVLVFTYNGFPYRFTAQGVANAHISYSYYDLGQSWDDHEIFGFQVVGYLAPGNLTPSGYANTVGNFESTLPIRWCPAGVTAPSGTANTMPASAENNLRLEAAIDDIFLSPVLFTYKSSQGQDSFPGTPVQRVEMTDFMFYQCYAPNAEGGRRLLTVRFNYSYTVDGVVPGVEGSVCTINGVTLSLDFESISPTVYMEKTVSLPVTCASGEAMNYKLSLTSGSADNGQLSFGNGVYAAVSVDGVPLPVNGDWIRLRALKTGTKNLKVTLSGTASSTGTSDATGILLLEVI